MAPRWAPKGDRPFMVLFVCNAMNHRQFPQFGCVRVLNAWLLSPPNRRVRRGEEFTEKLSFQSMDEWDQSIAITWERAHRGHDENKSPQKNIFTRRAYRRKQTYFYCRRRVSRLITTIRIVYRRRQGTRYNPGYNKIAWDTLLRSKPILFGLG